MLVFAAGIVLFALGICISVALHEAGHMVAAKAFGMKVRRYFIGFGPKVFSFRRGETEYGVKWVPFGGFCDIAGMTALDEVSEHEAPRAMWRYKVWKRTVVMVAGSLTHFVLGFVVLYLLATTLGLPNVFGSPVVSATTNCVQDATSRESTNHPECGPSDPAPAAQAGIQPGDEILAVGGERTPEWSDALFAIRGAEGSTTFTILRDGAKRTLPVDVATVTRPALNEQEKAEANEDGLVEVGAIGAANSKYLQFDPAGAVGATFSYTGEMFDRTWQGLLNIPEKVPEVVSAVFGEDVQERPVSVVGASRIGGQLAEAGLWALFLLLLANLNFFVGIFNLLPLLPLDGGHIAVTWYEKVRDWLRRLRGKQAGGPADYNKLSSVTAVIIVIGGAFVLLTVIADIVNPVQVMQ